jgi:outer membrane protein TolC
MKDPLWLFALACLWPAAAGLAQPPEKNAALNGLLAVTRQQDAASETPAMTLGDVERAALAENADIRLAKRRVTTAEKKVPLAGALDDPQFMARSWGVPLKKPWDYNQSQNMLMVGQNFPGAGKRGLRTALAQSEPEIAKADLAAMQLRVRVEVRKSFYDLLRAQDELRIHEEHVAVAQQAIEAARIKYTVGKVPQVEVLRAQLAMTRLAEHMIRYERDGGVSRARLNALMGREAGLPLHVQGAYGLEKKLPGEDELIRKAMEARPDLQQLAVKTERGRRNEAVMKKNFAPDFSVNAGYMLMPTGQEFRNNYMVEGSATLPWLNKSRHNAEVAEAAAETVEAQAELDAMRVAVRGQIGEALAETAAAQKLARVYETDLRKSAEDTLHGAVIAYENDQITFMELLDSQMAVVDVDSAWIDALGEFAKKMADLEMAVGAPLENEAEGAAEESK